MSQKNFVDHLISNSNGKIDISLSKARLLAYISTDFKALINTASQNQAQDARVDLIAKIEDLTIKVRDNFTLDFNNDYLY